MVGSSVIAAWADISSTLSSLADIAVVDPTSGAEVPLPSGVIGSLNAGYLWMAVNCLASAAYVRLVSISRGSLYLLGLYVGK